MSRGSRLRQQVLLASKHSQPRHVSDQAQDLEVQAKVPAQEWQPVVILALLQQLVHATARAPEAQRVSDIQEEQRCEDASIWDTSQRHSRAPALHGLALCSVLHTFVQPRKNNRFCRGLGVSHSGSLWRTAEETAHMNAFSIIQKVLGLFYVTLDIFTLFHTYGNLKAREGKREAHAHHEEEMMH